MRHEEYYRRVHGSGEDASGKLLYFPFLRKVRISLYDAVQEIQPGLPESCDVHQQKISKFAACKHRVDPRRDGGRRVFR